MITVAESAIIARPLEEVFDTAVDPLTQHEWDAGTLLSIEKLTPGPLTRGARYRGTFKGFGTVEYEFVEYERPRRFMHRTAMRMGEMHHVFTFVPVAEGTRMTQEMRIQPSVVGRIMQPVMTRMLRRRFRTIAAEISQHLATRTGV